VPQLRNQYKAARTFYAPAAAQPGDQALFSFGQGHTGIVESVNFVRRTVTCIEGNTSPGSAGSQDNGGGVYRRTRGFSTMWGVGRPAFTTPPVPAPSPIYKDDMRCVTVEVPGLDSTGHGYTDLFDVPAGTVVGVRVNTAHYADVAGSPGDEDYAGYARLQWVGKPNQPAFSARVWVAEPV
jgi:hypothetical protein